MSRWLYQLSYRSSGASFGQNTLFRSIHLHGPDGANTDATRAYCTLFLVKCKKARFDVDGQRGGRAQSRAHAALHTLVLIMPVRPSPAGSRSPCRRHLVSPTVRESKNLPAAA